MLTNCELSITDEDDNNLYVDHFLTMICNMQVQGGLSPSDMEKRVALLKVIKATEKGDEFKFSAEQFTDLKRLWNDSRWGMPHEDILTVGRSIIAAAEEA